MEERSLKPPSWESGLAAARGDNRLRLESRDREGPSAQFLSFSGFGWQNTINVITFSIHQKWRCWTITKSTCPKKNYKPAQCKLSGCISGVRSLQLLFFSEREKKKWTRCKISPYHPFVFIFSTSTSWHVFCSCSALLQMEAKEPHRVWYLRLATHPINLNHFLKASGGFSSWLSRKAPAVPPPPLPLQRSGCRAHIQAEYYETDLISRACCRLRYGSFVLLILA